MLHKTRGIVFNKTKYSETSIIIKIYTEKFGLQSYIVRGVRKAKSKFSSALFDHLSLLDLVVYKREKSNLQNLKEVKRDYQFRTIHQDIIKSSILIFLNEILLKSIKEEESNPSLFNFISDSIKTLDNSEHPVNFHIAFMIKLTRFLGFFPQNNYSGYNQHFNLQEGIFQQNPLSDRNISVDLPLSKTLSNLIKIPLGEHGHISISSAIRKEIISKLITYYELHLPGFKNIKSHHVLREVLS